LNLLSIIDCGGAPEMPALARIISEEDRPFIALMDSDSVKSLNKLKKIIKEAADLKEIREFKAEATVIQELLPKEIYAQAVNKYINTLVLAENLKLKDGVIKRDFVPSNNGKLDKQVEAFVSELYDDDSISKVGVANEFEKIVLSPQFSMNGSDFQSSFALIEWVIEQLKLKENI